MPLGVLRNGWETRKVEYESFKGHVVPISYYDHNALYGTPDELFSNSFNGSRDITVEIWMSRLVDGGVIFLSPSEQFSGIDPSHKENCVYGYFKKLEELNDHLMIAKRRVLGRQLRRFLGWHCGMKGLSRTNSSAATTKGVSPKRISAKGQVESQGEFWNVIRILKESGTKYQVQWDGIDPKTGKGWLPSWIPKSDCTDALVREWEDEKRKRKLEREVKLRRQHSSVSSGTPTDSAAAAPVKGPAKEEDAIGMKPMSRSPYAEITRKRPRSPVPKASPSKVEQHSSPKSEISIQSRKRRRIIQNSEQEELDREIPTPANQSSKLDNHNASHGSGRGSSNRTIVPDSEPGEDDPSQDTNSTSFERKNPKSLRPVPPLSPSFFHDSLGPPPSQIEDFPDSDSAIPRRSYPHQSSSKIPEKRMTGSFVSRMNQIKASREAFPVAKSDGIPESDVEPKIKAPAPGMDQEDPIQESCDVDALERVSVERDLEGTESNPPNDTSNPSHPTMEETKESPATGRTIENSERVTIEDVERKWRLKLTAKDATIESLETSIKLMQDERAVYEKRFSATIQEHVLAQRALEQQVASLTTALKQFGTMSPEGVDAIIQQTLAASQETSTDVGVEGMVPTHPMSHVRSEEDEALIAQLQADNTRLKDSLVESQRAKASTDAMVEQMRDVARRAEAAKMELARQSRIDKEVARNAPTHFKDLYQSQLDEAKREIAELRAQVGILEAQSKLTGDVVRNRAARAEDFARKYNELVKKRDELLEDIYIAENERDDALFKLHDMQEKLKQTTLALSNPADLHKLPEILQDIVSQSVSSVRMDDYITDSTDGDEDRRSNTGTTASFARLRPVTGDDGSAMSEEDHGRYFAMALEEAEASQSKSIDPRELALPSQRLEGSLEAEIFVYACLWQSDSSCRRHYQSREALLDHIFRDHLNL